MTKRRAACVSGRSAVLKMSHKEADEIAGQAGLDSDTKLPSAQESKLAGGAVPVPESKANQVGTPRADSNSKETDNEFMKDIIDATTEGRVEVVRFLLPSVADPNARLGSSGATLMYIAARGGWGQICAALLEDPRVKPAQPNKRGFTPLFAAALHGHVGAVQALSSALAAKRGVDVTAGLANGFTPLHAAAQNDHDNVVDRLAMNPRVDINRRAKSGATAVFVAARKGAAKALKVLLRFESVDPSKPTYAGNTPLFVASINGHLSCVRLLMSHPAVDVAGNGPDGCTPIWGAATNNHLEILRVLLEDGTIYPDTPDKVRCAVVLSAQPGSHLVPVQDGNTPLLVAVENGHFEAAKLLVADTRVEPWRANNVNSTPFIAAACNGDMDIVEFLAAQAGTPQLLNIADADGHTAFFMACCNGSLSVVRYLAARPDVEVQSFDPSGYSPFIIAAANGHLAVVELLAADESRVTVGTPRVPGGPTALLVACEAGQAEVVRFLLSDERVDVSCNDHQVCNR